MSSFVFAAKKSLDSFGFVELGSLPSAEYPTSWVDFVKKALSAVANSLALAWQRCWVRHLKPL